MVIEDVANVSGDLVSGLIADIGRIGLWLQAIGVLVVVWIIVQAVTLYFNRKRRIAIYDLKGNLERIESKIDKLLRRK